ncbi:hypothetical protein ACLOJK_034132 [Asimina triloba]
MSWSASPRDGRELPDSCNPSIRGAWPLDRGRWTLVEALLPRLWTEQDVPSDLDLVRRMELKTLDLEGRRTVDGLISDLGRWRCPWSEKMVMEANDHGKLSLVSSGRRRRAVAICRDRRRTVLARADGVRTDDAWVVACDRGV